MVLIVPRELALDLQGGKSHVIYIGIGQER